MLAGAGLTSPEWAGKRSKYMQGRGGEASYGELLSYQVQQFI